jgi:hypothetical protein
MTDCTYYVAFVFPLNSPLRKKSPVRCCLWAKAVTLSAFNDSVCELIWLSVFATLNNTGVPIAEAVDTIRQGHYFFGEVDDLGQCDARSTSWRTQEGKNTVKMANKERERLLDPIDRISEILFGLIMAVTIIGSLSIASAGHSQVRTATLSAFGCNLAWGLVDAVMYLISSGQ